MSDYKLNKTERIDVEEVLKDLEHYHPRRRGWTWRKAVPGLKMGKVKSAKYVRVFEGLSICKDDLEKAL